MNREDALQILHRVIEFCSENSLNVNSISLIAPSEGNGLKGYQLQIGTILDDCCRKSLMLLLKSKDLEMQENKDHILIFKPS